MDTFELKNKAHDKKATIYTRVYTWQFASIEALDVVFTSMVMNIPSIPRWRIDPMTACPEYRHLYLWVSSQAKDRSEQLQSSRSYCCPRIHQRHMYICANRPRINLSNL